MSKKATKFQRKAMSRMYRAFSTAQKHCDTWRDYEMSVAPYETDKPIYYEFTACPAAEFAKQFGFADIMPALCEDLKPYITAKDKQKKWLFGTVGMAVISAVLATVTMTFIR